MSETLSSPFLPAAVLDGTETLLVVQNPPNGVLRKTTTQDIADLATVPSVPFLQVTTDPLDPTTTVTVTVASDVAAVQRFWFEVLSTVSADPPQSFAVSTGGAGSIEYTASLNRYLCVTDASGVCMIDITDEVAETISVGVGTGPGCTTPFETNGPYVITFTGAP